ncbi:hypothetical protein [Desulfobacter latus]|uniref:Uncharacterized protein n=1 Tax=Desulfobacter latus TaxID=2292 RepID=A0A850TDT4_9BACT|nr:hypothetical protein [Desulfobacter latus]NWH06447.1 hypothetical protein [Desulfobacter latus]
MTNSVYCGREQLFSKNISKNCQKLLRSVAFKICYRMDAYPQVDEWPYPKFSELCEKGREKELDATLKEISHEIWIFLKSRFSNRMPLNSALIVNGFINHMLDQRQKKNSSDQWLRTNKALRRALREKKEIHKDKRKNWTYYSYAPIDKDALMDEALARKKQINFSEWEVPCVDRRILFDRMQRSLLLKISKQFWYQVQKTMGKPYGLTVGVTLAYMKAHYIDLSDKTMVHASILEEEKDLPENYYSAKVDNQNNLICEINACVEGKKKWSIERRQVLWLYCLKGLTFANIAALLGLEKASGAKYHWNEASYSVEGHVNNHWNSAFSAVEKHVKKWHGPKFPAIPEALYLEFLSQLASYCQKTAPLSTLQNQCLEQILKEKKK